MTFFISTFLPDRKAGLLLRFTVLVQKNAFSIFLKTTLQSPDIPFGVLFT